MRKLGLTDAFALARIIKAADIRKDLVAFATEVEARKKAGNKLSADDIGLEFIISMITSISSQEVETKIYELYASLKDCSVDDIKITDFETLKNDIKEIIELNNLKAFFHSVSALMSKQQG